MITLVLTWDQFQELRAQLDAINHAHRLDVIAGEVKNTIVESEWDADGVEIQLDI